MNVMNHLQRWWPWALTIAALLGSIAVYVLSPDMTTRGQVGDYLSGFASAIAFIWLIAAYLQQGRDLRLQRQELALQRQSLDLQREELKKLGKYAGLEQISHLLDQFDLSLRNNFKSPARSTGDLPTAFMNGMNLWKTILESKDPNVVLAAYTQWIGIYAPCLEFVARVASAIDLYCEASGHPPIYPTAQPAERIFLGYEQIKTIPHVSNYAGAAYSIASNLIHLTPGIDRLQLAGMEASESLMPGVAKVDALAELRAKVKAHDESIDSAKAKKI